MVTVHIYDCKNGFVVEIQDSEAEDGKTEYTKVYEFGSGAEMIEQLCFTLGVHDEVYANDDGKPKEEAPGKDNLTPTEDLI